MADIVDINVFETIDNVVINATPNVIEVNINRTTSTGGVTSVNNETGIVLLDTNDIPETAAKVFVTPTEKTAITHTNRTILDAITEAFTTTLKSSYDSAVTWISTNGATLISHLTNYSNPHQTTASQVGAYTTTQTDTLLNGKVPYTGATTNVDLGEFQLKAGQLEFDQTPTGTAEVGKLVWNDTDGTLDLGLKGGNVTLQVGQEQVLRVVNKTATNISLLESNYQAVRVTGAQGLRLKVDLALATNDLLSAETIGLVTETIANNQEGFITTSGLIRGINTTGSLQGETWIDGDVIYLSPTIAGNVTNIKPIAPNHLIIIGYVVSAHITQGTIFVKVDNGYELNELHNVKIDTPLNAEVLGYENSTSLWKNKSIATWLGYKSPSEDGTILYHSTKWFTPTSTISTSGTTATSVGTQFTSAMVGAKLTISGEFRIITAFISTTQVTVASAYSINYSGIAAANWVVYSKAYETINSNQYTNQGVLFVSNFSNDVSGIGFKSSGNYFRLGNSAYELFNGGGILWSNSASNYAAVKDLGLRRNAAGILEIYDGITATGLEANRRDLLARNIFGSTQIVGGTSLNTSAISQVDSTSKGFLPPRMTTTQKNAIATPAAGLIVYDTTTNKACCYNGTTWNDLF